MTPSPEATDPAQRTYTRTEANAFLPELTERLERIRRARRVLIETAQQVDTDAPVTNEGPAGPYLQASQTLKRELEAVIAAGVVLREAETGLVDFSGNVDGESVWLCWKLGEPEVGFWHPLDTGFSSRNPLPPEPA